MYELIKKQISEDYFQQRFPNDGQRFVAWYLRNILFRDMNETRDDITDGGDDKQIDAIVIDDDKTLVRTYAGVIHSERHCRCRTITRSTVRMDSDQRPCAASERGESQIAAQAR